MLIITRLPKFLFHWIKIYYYVITTSNGWSWCHKTFKVIASNFMIINIMNSQCFHFTQYKLKALSIFNIFIICECQIINLISVFWFSIWVFYFNFFVNKDLIYCKPHSFQTIWIVSMVMWASLLYLLSRWTWIKPLHLYFIILFYFAN